MTLAADPVAERPPSRSAARVSSTVAAAVAAFIVFAAALFRQSGVPKIETLWAEDGAVFLQCAYDNGPLGCLATSYQGYLHLVPRLVAAIAGAVPPTAAPIVIGLLAALLAAGAAAIAARSIADLTSSPLAGLLGGAGFGLVWQAGREVLGNISNVHWVLFGATVVVIVCSWSSGPGSRIGRWSIGLAAITGLTSPFAPIIPVLALGSVVARRPRALPLFIVSTLVAMVQVAIELTTNRAIPSGPGVTAGGIGKFFTDEVVRQGIFGQAPFPPDLLVPVLLVVLLAGIAFGQPDRRVVLRAATGVIALVAIGFAICFVSVVLNRGTNPRYAYFPASMLVAVLAIAGGFLAATLRRGSPRAQRLAGFVMPSIVIVMGIGFALSFRLEARASTGPNVPAEIQAAAATCTPGALATIRISPAPASNVWAVMIPCSRLTSR